MSGRLAVRTALLVITVVVAGAFTSPSTASTIRIACYGWNSAPAACFDEARDDTLRCDLGSLVGPDFNGSIYHFGFISRGNDNICSGLGDTEPDSSCTYDLTAWFEPGSIPIGHVVGPGGNDQAASIEGPQWQGHIPTDFTAVRLEYQQRAPCNDIRTTIVPIHWAQLAPPSDKGPILVWGRNDYGQCAGPDPDSLFFSIAAGCFHSLGLKADGSLVAWGSNPEGQCDIPSPNSGFVAVSGSWATSFGLKSDGTIRGWGRNDWGQCNPPSPNSGFVAVSAAGGEHVLGLKADGRIIAWGDCRCGKCDVPLPNSDFVAIAAGYDHSLALRADSSIAAWGCCDSGECDVPQPNAGFIAIAAGGHYSLAIRSDGSVVAWGSNDRGQCNVPEPNADFVEVAGGEFHSLGLKSDGSIIAWGSNLFGQCTVPDPNAGYGAIAAGYGHSMALRTTTPGACCLPDGRCIYSLEEQCAAVGVWQGTGSSCQPNPCPPGGACCQSDGTCMVTTETNCASPGIWQGPDTTCEPNPCFHGACCLQYVCDWHTQSGCLARGGVFMGNGTLCEPNPCVSGVDDASRVTTLSLTASPNPSTGQVVIRYALPKPTVVTIELFNASGSLVRRIDKGQRAAGAYSTPWDGRDDNGRELPTGVYFARIVAGQGSAMGRAVIAR